jgi:hypothetical protein
MGSVIDQATGGMFSDLTGRTGEKAAANAAALQGAATDKATAETRRQFDLGREDMAPWLAAGRTGLGKYQEALGLNGDPSSAMRELQSSPGYQFRLAQGQRGLNAGLAARGGMGAGKAMNAATQYGQDYASNEYENRLNRLAGLSTMGQGTALNQAQMGNQNAQNMSNLWTQNANAQGAAGMAGANARQSGLLGLVQMGTNILSDRRLKTDITRIGTHESGIGMYSWKYKSMPDDFPIEHAHLAEWGQPATGVMADEVMEVMPEAVVRVGNYYAVNYAMLGA